MQRQPTAWNAATRDCQPDAKQEGQDARVFSSGETFMMGANSGRKLEKDMSRARWIRSRVGTTRKQRRGRGHTTRRALEWKQTQMGMTKIDDTKATKGKPGQAVSGSRLKSRALVLASKILSRMHRMVANKRRIKMWRRNIEVYWNARRAKECRMLLTLKVLNRIQRTVVRLVAKTRTIKSWKRNFETAGKAHRAKECRAGWESVDQSVPMDWGRLAGRVHMQGSGLIKVAHEVARDMGEGKVWSRKEEGAAAFSYSTDAMAWEFDVKKEDGRSLEDRVREAMLRRELRGLVIGEEGVIARPMHRFFATGQVKDTKMSAIGMYRITEATVKRDGVMVFGVVRKGSAELWSRGGFTKEGKAATRFAGEQTDKDILGMIGECEDKGFTAIMEWCGRQARIKTKELETELVLTKVRSKVSGKYMGYIEMAQLAQKYGVDVVERAVELEGMRLCEAVEKVRHMQCKLEDFVVKLETEQLVKIKTVWWTHTERHTHMQWYSERHREIERLKQVKRKTEMKLKICRLAVKGLGGSETPSRLLLAPGAMKVEAFYERATGSRGAVIVSFENRAERDSAAGWCEDHGMAAVEAYSRCSSGNAYHKVMTWWADGSTSKRKSYMENGNTTTEHNKQHDIIHILTNDMATQTEKGQRQGGGKAGGKGGGYGKGAGTRVSTIREGGGQAIRKWNVQNEIDQAESNAMCKAAREESHRKQEEETGREEKLKLRELASDRLDQLEREMHTTEVQVITAAGFADLRVDKGHREIIEIMCEMDIEGALICRELNEVYQQKCKEYNDQTAAMFQEKDRLKQEKKERRRKGWG